MLKLHELRCDFSEVFIPRGLPGKLQAERATQGATKREACRDKKSGKVGISANTADHSTEILNCKCNYYMVQDILWEITGEAIRIKFVGRD